VPRKCKTKACSEANVGCDELPGTNEELGDRLLLLIETLDLCLTILFYKKIETAFVVRIDKDNSRFPCIVQKEIG
jgi:hypothetical protein